MDEPLRPQRVEMNSGPFASIDLEYGMQDKMTFTENYEPKPISFRKPSRLDTSMQTFNMDIGKISSLYSSPI